MYTKRSKKFLILNILNILRRYSDAQHRLSQQDILDLLYREYEMVADRKSIKRNLMDLIDFGYPLEYTEILRQTKEGEETNIYTDWYLERDFSDAELRLLIDSLLFSKHIPYNQCKKLIEKIKGLSSQFFQAKVRHIRSLPSDQPQNAQLFYTLEVLDEAIEQNKQVVFHYGSYGIDKKLRLKQNKAGDPQNYQVSPYQMVTANGRYYLIANTNRHNNLSHYRLDRIRDIELTSLPTKPLREVEGLENGLNLPQHMAEHIYMFSGESAAITLRTTPDMAGELIDWFGNGVTFTNETETSVIAHVKANVHAMQYWAMQYAPYVTILAPQTLVDTVKEGLRKALKQYEAI